MYTTYFEYKYFFSPLYKVVNLELFEQNMFCNLINLYSLRGKKENIHFFYISFFYVFHYLLNIPLCRSTYPHTNHAVSFNLSLLLCKFFSVDYFFSLGFRYTIYVCSFLSGILQKRPNDNNYFYLIPPFNL